MPFTILEIQANDICGYELPGSTIRQNISAEFICGGGGY